MKILFIHNTLSTFVRADLDILKSQNLVKEIKFSFDKNYVSSVAQEIHGCDLVFGWWASWHMLFPILCAQRYGKPIVVVGGDYDVIYKRQFKSQRRIFMDRIRKYLGYIIFPRINNFIVNSEFSKKQALRLPYIIPERVTRIYHGLPDIAAGRENIKKNLILSVGTINQYDIYRKGYATFVKSAAYLPEYRFQLVGSWKDDSVELLRSWNDKNVSYPGYLPERDLYQSMSDAKVYVQVSHHEGFGMALAEAMLFRCAPVVTDRGAIPEVVGDCGLFVPYGDPRKTAHSIQEACEQSWKLGTMARERILSKFPLENRKSQLLDIIEKTYSNQR